MTDIALAVLDMAGTTVTDRGLVDVGQFDFVPLFVQP